MKKFKNISQVNQDTCKLLLYGYVGIWDEVSSAQVVAELDAAAQIYTKCNVHVNSNGGEVFEGIAIFNALRQSKMDITIYIDGVAASIASVIAMCGRPVRMSRFARMMIHSVSGGVFGNAQDMEKAIKEIKTVQDILITIVAERTGLQADEVNQKWFDGMDHWLNASEALELKLINEIYDGVPVAIPEEIATDPRQLTNLFNNALKSDNKMFNKLFERLRLSNTATEDEVLNKVGEIEKKAADLEADNTTLKAENVKLKKELDDKKAAEAAAEEAEINTAIENAVNDGRIKDAQKAHFTAILKADKTNGMAILNGLSKPKRIKNQLSETDEDEERAKWSFDDWSKKDSAGLQNMKANDPERFKSLYKAKYNKEPKL